MTLTAEEKTARQLGIGGSDIAAIIGADKNKGPLVIYGNKVEGIDPPLYDNDTAARRGNLLEPFAASIYSERTGRKVVEVNSYKKEWRIASTDRIALRPGAPEPRINDKGRANFTFIEACPWAERIVEIKCPTAHTIWDWGPETGIPINPRNAHGVPYKYVLQCVWYMQVTGIHKCDLAALVDTELRIYPIEYNTLFAEAIEEAASIFWNTHVIPKVPPPADWRPTTHKYLLERFPEPEIGFMLDPTEESMNLAMHLRMTKDLLRQHGIIADELQNKLCAMIGDAQGIDGLCTWNRSTGRVAWEEVVNSLVEAGTITEEFKIELMEQYRNKSGRTFRLLGSMDQ